MNLIPLMNDTKWDELRLAMHTLDPSPRWRTKDIESGYESDWDNEWFYHFCAGGYVTIEWVEIEARSEQEWQMVFQALQEVRVPGERTENGFRIRGYGLPSETVKRL